MRACAFGSTRRGGLRRGRVCRPFPRFCLGDLSAHRCSMASSGKADAEVSSVVASELPADFLVGLQARLSEHGSELPLQFKAEPEDFEVVELDDDGNSVPYSSPELGLQELEEECAEATRARIALAAARADNKPIAPSGPDDWEKLRMRDPGRAAAHLESVLGRHAAGALARQAGALGGGDTVQQQLPDSVKETVTRWVEESSQAGGVPALVDAPAEKAPRTLVYLACACLFPHAEVQARRRGEVSAPGDPTPAPAADEWVLALHEDATAASLRRVLDAVDWAPVLRLLRLEARMPASERAGYGLRGAYPDKERRREVHQALATAHRGLATSSAHGSVTIRWRPPRGGRGDRKRPRDSAVAPTQHIAFTLTKRGTEQHTALAAAAAALGVPIHAISIRGNKDKCAVTRQRCVVAGSAPRRVADACAQLGAGGAVELSDLGPASGPLTIGHLSGNRFKIVLRRCAAPAAEVARRAEALATRGFVNFFGPQRVGFVSQEPQPWRIGAALLRGAWQEAVTLVLTANGRDSPAVAAAKAALHAGQPLPQVRDMFPASSVRERALVKGMIRYGAGSPLLALKQVPFHARTLWTGALSAHVFNALADRRLRNLGPHPVPGDLVLEPEPADEGKAGAGAGPVRAGGGRGGGWRARVRLVTEADFLPSAPWRPRLSDVVLPMPGSSVQLPSHSVGTAYRDLLRDLDVDYSASPAAKAGMTPTLRGTYRRLVEIPTQVEWRRAGGEGARTGIDGPPAPLVLAFSLREGCYATMALREFVGAA